MNAKKIKRPNRHSKEFQERVRRDRKRFSKCATSASIHVQEAFQEMCVCLNVESWEPFPTLNRLYPLTEALSALHRALHAIRGYQMGGLSYVPPGGLSSTDMQIILDGRVFEHSHSENNMRHAKFPSLLDD